MEKVSVLLLLLLLILSCGNKNTICNQLSEGTFNLYENSQLIGQLFRKNNVQIEKYPNKKSYIIGKFKYISECQLHIKHYYIEEPIDTITWLVSYIPLADDTFEINAKPAFISTLNYTYKAKMVKISHTIDPEFDQLIKGIIKGNEPR